jgi:hypothetical protein
MRRSWPIPGLLIQFNYARRSIKTMVSQPNFDSRRGGRAMVTSLGGKRLDHRLALGKAEKEPLTGELQSPRGRALAESSTVSDRPMSKTRTAYETGLN